MMLGMIIIIIIIIITIIIPIIITIMEKFSGNLKAEQFRTSLRERFWPSRFNFGLCTFLHGCLGTIMDFLCYGRKIF